jgi:hypothetical protein
MCFSEHHLKQIELEDINLEGYKLGAAYCRKSLLKGGVYIFVYKKYNYSNVDLNKLIHSFINPVDEDTLI